MSLPGSVSPPTSVSSLGFEADSPHSRSTTPSSEISGRGAAPTGLDVDSVPWAALPSHTFDADVLQLVFDKHSSCGQLGFLLGCKSSSSHDEMETSLSTLGEWDQLSLSALSSFASEPSKYFISRNIKLSCADAKPVICTTDGYAAHLKALSRAQFRSMACLSTSDGQYLLHIVEKPSFVFPPISHTPGLVRASNVPTLDEWRTLWSAWDLVTLGMIPQEMLHQKPIDLRHKCLFYIGHIPTFLDMLLSKAIGGGPSEPKHFWNIFERGIDPHVDDPDHCHNHSEVPEKDEDWPSLEAIMGFRNRVRGRLAQLYVGLHQGQRALTRNIARTLVMTLEHEGFHVETLLYMLIQRAGTGTLPPPGFITPNWSLLASQWSNTPPPTSDTVTLGPTELIMGHQDDEGEDDLPENKLNIENHIFGWDNESPSRAVQVGKFAIDWRPITNQQYLDFFAGDGKGKVEIPMSWVEEDGKYKIRTVYGPVPMSVARHWPVLASYDDLQTYAKAKGGRLPTEPELRLFFDTYDVGHEDGANVGFRNWHPVPATTGLEETNGKGSNGGVWEWTSTLFDTHVGISPTKLFTGYSTDFFDQKHQVVLGASYATIPRLCRRTVRNFYQHNYPYAWVGARVAYDL
ncbi:hypothetical protein BDN72DRAFT_853905 [Pluteus cervinus]|uniref:Uncharacterized protein n=1 Tax=Pluteus cervinus TaxID=181527 RepID=A0ACD3BA92_9AGAR|nr:hypothetical protein BDN72DRAFT_853905 [Pluteus cervinus]